MAELIASRIIAGKFILQKMLKKQIEDANNSHKNYYLFNCRLKHLKKKILELEIWPQLKAITTKSWKKTERSVI